MVCPTSREPHWWSSPPMGQIGGEPHRWSSPLMVCASVGPTRAHSLPPTPIGGVLIGWASPPTGGTSTLVVQEAVNRARMGNVIREEVAKGLNPGLIVLLFVVGMLLVFFVGNYALYAYAQKTLPPRKKKPISKKKMKKERLKQGVSAPGE
ncbi:hypothetical protein Taro_027364 [Colocasia esculenta]|uniref:DNA-binding protein S1FA n=1 Tax=Colocasia esculenta TaxID=4460 RepID=A0A843VU39_COLES|nr:hypothetical protein [Colocasia esculenta]